MTPDLTDEETAALIRLLRGRIDGDPAIRSRHAYEP
jgi:hypothetical protein